ncbi:hypothetical protein RFI_23806, partial [Reticulomyxa filosa]
NKNAKTLAPQQALFAALAAINAAENTSIGMTCGNSDVDIIGSLFEHEEWTSGEDNNDIYIDDDSINYCELGISTPETTATAACHPKTTETKDCKKYPDTSQKLMGLFNDHSVNANANNNIPFSNNVSNATTSYANSNQMCFYLFFETSFYVLSVLTPQTN